MTAEQKLLLKILYLQKATDQKPYFQKWKCQKAFSAKKVTCKNSFVQLKRTLSKNGHAKNSIAKTW